MTTLPLVRLRPAKRPCSCGTGFTLLHRHQMTILLKGYVLSGFYGTPSAYPDSPSSFADAPSSFTGVPFSFPDAPSRKAAGTIPKRSGLRGFQVSTSRLLVSQSGLPSRAGHDAGLAAMCAAPRAILSTVLRLVSSCLNRVTAVFLLIGLIRCRHRPVCIQYQCVIHAERRAGIVVQGHDGNLVPAFTRSVVA